MKATRENVTKQFQAESGLKLSAAKKLIAEKMKNDPYNNDIRTTSVRLFYTSNERFEGGKPKGGKGWYFAVRASGLSTTIKLS